MPDGLRLLPGGSFVRIGLGPDATTWARPDGEAIEQIRYKLRYTPDRVTPSEMMLAAAALCSYVALVDKPSKRRSTIIRGLRLARRLSAEGATVSTFDPCSTSPNAEGPKR